MSHGSSLIERPYWWKPFIERRLASSVALLEKKVANS